MDLSMHERAEDYLYRHKKFDQGKRPRDEDLLQDLEQLNRACSSPANALLLTSYFHRVERFSTPFSTDSNCSSEYVGFVRHLNASSTPSSKRQHVLSGGQFSISNPIQDSGVSLTPKKQVAANKSLPSHQIRCLLKPSSLAQPPYRKQKIVKVQAGGISKKQNYTIARKRYDKSNCSGLSTTDICSDSSDINTPSNASGVISSVTKVNKSVSPVSANSIKAVMKPTEVGTLELPTIADPVANNSGQQLDASAVLSRIGEDKLRSICTFHRNMVRKFPKKERSLKDQQRRNKNTIACRMSRRIKKLEQIAFEEECKEVEQQQQAMMEEMLRATAYLDQLELLMAHTHISDNEETEIDVVNVGDESESVTDSTSKLNNKTGSVHMLPSAVTLPTTSIKSHPFSIACLLGNTSAINAWILCFFLKYKELNYENIYMYVSYNYLYYLLKEIFFIKK